MTSILFFIAGIALGFWIKGQTTSTFTPRKPKELKVMRKNARKALTNRTEKRKKKILNLMTGEIIHQEELKACGVTNVKEGITSKNVKKLLDISGATARKYLNELEKENKIKQIGDSGRDVYYVLST